MRIPRCDVVLASVPLLTAMALGGAIAAVGARPNRPKNSVTANKLLKDRIFSDFLCIFAAPVMGLPIGPGAISSGPCGGCATIGGFN